jgi:Ca2+-binding EF-hand superfamily protein
MMSYTEDMDDIYMLAYNKFKENNGKIKTDMLGNLLRYLNFDPTEMELKEYIHISDVDHCGFISVDGFLLMMKHVRKPFTMSDLEDAFEYLDKNKNHKISSEELKAILCSGGDALTKEEMEAVLMDIDISNDGSISTKDLIGKLMAIRK